MSKKVIARLAIDDERHWNRLINKTFVQLQDPSHLGIRDSRVHVSSSVYDFENVSSQDIILGNILLQNKEIPFIQLKTSSNINDAFKQMIMTWDIYAPHAVLILRSDLCFLTKENKTKLENKLVKSIMETAFSVHKMWLCTHGLNIEFANTMANAFHVVNRSHHMHHIENYSDTPVRIIETPLIGICEKNIFTNSMQKCRKTENNSIYCDQVDLNPHHSHFVFVSDDMYPAMNYDYFFSKFECALRDNQQASSTIKTKVPVIAILAGGKETCIDYLLLHIQQSLPALVVYGSGGLADIIAFAYFEINRCGLRSNDKEYRENLLEPTLCRKISIAFPNLNEKLYDYIIENILKCIWVPEKPSSEYIYILDAHDRSMELEHLSYHMLCALFKSQRRNIVEWHLQMKSDLLLTIDWNCPDVALSEVFLLYPLFTVTSSIFETVLFTKGQEAFVSLFLQRGFRVHKFLTANQLVSLFQKSRSENFFHNIFWKGFMQCEGGNMITEEFIDIVLGSMIECLTNIPFHVSSEELDLNAIGIYSTKFEKRYDAIFAEQKALSLLIIWSLISNRIKLANILLYYTGMPVMLAFISCTVLGHLLPYVTENSIRTIILAESRRFCDAANGVFRKAYDVAPDRAWKLLSERNPIWANHTLPQVAMMCQNYDFLSHECFQKWTTRMYMGGIRMRELSHGWFKIPVYTKVLLSAIFVVPVYFWIGFEQSSASSRTHIDFDDGSPIRKNYSEKRSKIFLTRQSYKRKVSDSIVHFQTNLPLWKMILSIWTAPVTKFWSGYILYILFLILFCFATIWPSCGQKYLELSICVWIASITLENVCCFYLSREIYSHSMSRLKSLEIFYMTIFVCFILFNRFYVENSEPYANKFILCFGLIFFHYRAMYTYMPIFSTLGPLLYRVKIIVFVDFIHYLCLVFFVMISNGIVLEALIFPDYPFTIELIRRSFQNGWMQLLINMPYRIQSDEVRCSSWTRVSINKSECSLNSYFDYDCPYFDIWPLIIMIHYMIIAKLVFTPLIFAVVLAAHERLRIESEQHWNAYRYLLISEYTNCVSMPPPFNLVYYVVFIFKYVSCFCCHRIANCKCWKDRKNGNKPFSESKPYSFGHYSFWKQIVHDYINEQENLQKESQYSKDKLNMISEFQEGVKYQEKTIYKANSQVAELESDVTNTRLFVRTSKYWVEQDNVPAFSIHVLSRHSPYPGTKIDRYPVPDKYVPWDVKWLNYIPTVYTAPNTDFPEHLQYFADSDIFRSDLPEDFSNFDERHEIRWNMNYTDSHGVYKRRRSWIKHSNGQALIYLLCHGMPQNPEGRTGLSGKGSLLQWGPNHHIFTIITKFKNLSTSNQLEFVAMTVRRNVLNLPGGFARTVNRYMVIQDYFTTDWETETDMKEFFESCAPKSNNESDETMKCEIVKRGYMDNPMNTDNAWKEVELWHVHYNVSTDIHAYFKPDLFWCTIDEKMFRKLPQGQGNLLKWVIHHMNVSRE